MGTNDQHEQRLLSYDRTKWGSFWWIWDGMVSVNDHPSPHLFSLHEKTRHESTSGALYPPLGRPTSITAVTSSRSLHSDLAIVSMQSDFLKFFWILCIIFPRTLDSSTGASNCNNSMFTAIVAVEYCLLFWLNKGKKYLIYGLEVGMSRSRPIRSQRTNPEGERQELVPQNKRTGSLILFFLT